MSSSCPSCATPMSRHCDERFEAWHCAKCALVYVPSETIAAVAARPSDLGAIIREAALAPISPRRLSCARCRGLSLHELKVRGVAVDICDICGGMVLDPGEEKVLNRLASSTSTKADAVIDHLAWNAEPVAHIVAFIAKTLR
jgi:Zn-finger nucleic acid-binding protein